MDPARREHDVATLLTRWFLRVVAVAFISAAVVLLFYAQGVHFWSAPLFLVAGIALLIVSFARRGDRVKTAVRDIIDADPWS